MRRNIVLINSFTVIQVILNKSVNRANILEHFPQPKFYFYFIAQNVTKAIMSWAMIVGRRISLNNKQVHSGQKWAPLRKIYWKATDIKKPLCNDIAIYEEKLDKLCRQTPP